MDDWGNDMPPPLSSLPDQLYAVTLADSIIGTSGLRQGDLRIAATTQCGQNSPPVAKPLKRGFLDCKPQKQQAGAGSKQRVPHIRARAAEQQQARQIPAMFKLEPSEDQKRYNMVKSQLLDALAPTPDTIAAVGSDPTLAAGFDDPEVMKAVAEVARDPSAIKKYANNPKVQQFYVAFGNLMGSKLESINKHQVTQNGQQHVSSKTSSSSYGEGSSSNSKKINRVFLP